MTVYYNVKNRRNDFVIIINNKEDILMTTRSLTVSDDRFLDDTCVDDWKKDIAEW